MNGECYFCNGIVSAAESGHILLSGHSGHEVYMHERCAEGHNLVETARSPTSEIEITCPECGAVETQ
jgi:phage FluMu protein Com